MKITKRQLRRIIKEEIENNANSLETKFTWIEVPPEKYWEEYNFVVPGHEDESDLFVAGPALNVNPLELVYIDSEDTDESGSYTNIYDEVMGMLQGTGVNRQLPNGAPVFLTGDYNYSVIWARKSDVANTRRVPGL